MGDVFAWLQGSALGTAMRESGAWTYPVVNLLHILAIATLFGSVLVLDLRLLGAWRQVPLPSLARPIEPLAAAGCVLALLTGTALLATNATDYVGNGFLYVKLPVVAVGVANAVVLRRTVAWREKGLRPLSARETRRLAAMGAVSLLVWLTAVTAGRMIAYW
ncbi:MAG: DUF6644 family protein [Vicinamibacterales bacterium]